MDQNLIEKAPKVNLSAVLSDIRKKIQVRKAKFRIQNTFSIDNNRSPHNAIFPQLPLESKNYIQVSKIKKKSATITNKALNHRNSESDYQLKGTSLKFTEIDKSSSFNTSKIKMHNPIKKTKIKSLIALPSVIVVKAEDNDLFSSNHTEKKAMLNKTGNNSGDLKIDRSPSIHMKLNSSLIVDVSPVSIKDIPSDPFHCSIIIKSPAFSPFGSILDKRYEYSGSSFPYFSRMAEPIFKLHKRNKGKANTTILSKVCNCKSNKIDKFNYLSLQRKSDTENCLPTLSQFLNRIPSLTRFFYYPQKVACFRNLIILNFEAIFVPINKKKYNIEPETWSTLLKLSSYFQLILVVSSTNKSRESIFQEFERQQIKIAGFYLWNSVISRNGEALKLQDYSQIYLDYECKYPEMSSIILTSHKIIDEVENLEDIISLDLGIRPKLNIERVPVSSLEYPETSCTVLLPKIEIGHSNIFLEAFTNNLIGSLQNFKSLIEIFNFITFFHDFKYCIIQSGIANQLLLEMLLPNLIQNEKKDHIPFRSSKNYIDHCKTHDRYFINYPGSLPKTTFIIKEPTIIIDDQE